MWDTLLAESRTLFREFLCKACAEDLQLHVIGEVASGREARIIMQRCRFDLAIVELALPDMSGVEVLRSLRAQSVPPRLLAIGRGCHPYILHSLLKIGIDGYVDRDATPLPLFKEAVATIKAGGRYLQRLNTLWQQCREQLDGGTAAALDRMLSPREISILRLIGYSLTDEEIALHAALSPGTVQSHRSHIMRNSMFRGRRN